MNSLTLSDFRERLADRLMLRARIFDVNRSASTFSSGGEPGSIQRVYVINLDRKPSRWQKVRRELERFRERHGEPISALARRFSAVDARYLDAEPPESTLIPFFTLADQLTVDPNPVLRIDAQSRATTIKMSRQEIAVALSHVEVWRLIADGDVPSALILEDDVFLPYGFARKLKTAWSELKALTSTEGGPVFDLLYLSFKEVGETQSERTGPVIRRSHPGIWQASGYVLSKPGAQKLLDLLPAFGPVDLWLNFQFENLDAYTTARPIIEQRIDEPSTNSYSVLPVLSQMGVITRERSLVPHSAHLPTPVLAIGKPGSGLTALATALSMVGYTCFSDSTELPSESRGLILSGNKKNSFNAFVNVGTITDAEIRHVLDIAPKARVIATSNNVLPPGLDPNRALRLYESPRDKWAALSEFLELEYPSHPYPTDLDLGQRQPISAPAKRQVDRASDLKFDRSPWILSRRNASGRRLVGQGFTRAEMNLAKTSWTKGETLDQTEWRLRDDTFPSNMALFRPENFASDALGNAVLTLQSEKTTVRDFTSAAIASRRKHLYGRFVAELRPAKASGMVTGMFLHRNGPRQEIDIEFLGRDTSLMLVNVFFNPGPEGTKLEYGYRGTPTIIELGFDASVDFHRYEIEWTREAIRWRVDGVLVYERVEWDPTPIPNRPMEFNVNLWTSRSVAFAGRIAKDNVAALTLIKSLEVQTQDRSDPAEDEQTTTEDAFPIPLLD